MVDIEKLRGLLARATAGPFDHMEGMGIVRALRGDVAIPLFETRTPWGDQHHGAPTVRLGKEVVFRANSEGARTSEALSREWNNAALVSAALNALPGLLDELERKTKALDAIKQTPTRPDIVARLESVRAYNGGRIPAVMEAATEIAALRAALKPFADCVDQIGPDESDQEWAKFRLLIGDYRRAAAALKGNPNEV